MTRRIPKEGSIPDGVRRRLAPLAAEHGVTVDRIVQVVRDRRKFRHASYERQRRRKGTMQKNPFVSKKHRQESGLMYSGEGELHAHLRALSLTSAQFCGLVGIRESTFSRWYGHPLHPWPVEFLRWYGYAKGMERVLQERGYDTETFRPKLPTRLRSEGRYPRKRGDLVVDGKPFGNWSPWDA